MREAYGLVRGVIGIVGSATTETMSTPRWLSCLRHHFDHLFSGHGVLEQKLCGFHDGAFWGFTPPASLSLSLFCGPTAERRFSVGIVVPTQNFGYKCGQRASKFHTVVKKPVVRTEEMEWRCASRSASLKPLSGKDLHEYAWTDVWIFLGSPYDKS